MNVDIVYTWVNHLDPHWQSLHNDALNNGRLPPDLHTSVNDKARYQNRNEIYYSINSIKRFAPWVRRIFIVTNCAIPQWAISDPQITAIDHAEIFPDNEDLPTFNAFAIEACLHRVPGLSEHFLYFNDDVFLLKAVSVQDFFPDEDTVSVFPSKHAIPDTRTPDLRPVEHSMLNARSVLEKKCGYIPAKKLHHAPFALLKSVMREIESENYLWLCKTRSHAFRDQTDLPLSTTLHAYYCLATGRGVIKEVSARYIDIGDPLFLLLILPYSPLWRGKYIFLCLNEVHAMRFFAGLRDHIVEMVMHRLFKN